MQTAPAAAAAAPRAPAQPLVTGLPDFTNLVEQVGPGVVNVDTTIVRNNRQAARGPMGDDDMPEFFRRFFGPDFPMPGQGPGGQDGGPSIKGRGMGSGFIISDDGYVLTNNHVIADADEIIVRLSDRSELQAKLVGTDPRTDVALLKVDGKNLPNIVTNVQAKLSQSKNIDWVIGLNADASNTEYLRGQIEAYLTAFGHFEPGREADAKRERVTAEITAAIAAQ